MNYILLKDWTSENKKLLITNSNYDKVKALYRIYLIYCYKHDLLVSGEEFCNQLKEKGMMAEIHELNCKTLKASDIEDELADILQAF